MTTMASTATAVIDGVDTQADVHIAVACDEIGTVLGTEALVGDQARMRQEAAFDVIVAVAISESSARAVVDGNLMDLNG